MSNDNDMVMTSSIDIEMMVLGCMINNAENASIGLKLVSDNDFFDRKHKIIFKTVSGVFNEKGSIDVALIQFNLKNINQLEHVGGLGYLTTLAQYAGTSSHLEAYCEDLKKLSIKRELISHVVSLTRDIENGINPLKIIEKSKLNLTAIEKKKPQFDFKIEPYTLQDLSYELCQTKEGLKTGYKELDEMVRIPNEAITLIGGRPSHGKTTLMLNLFLNMIEQYPNLHFYFFSYEETRQQIAVKIINILSEFVLNESQNILQLQGYLKSKSTNFGMIEAAKKKYDDLVRSGRLVIYSEPFYIQHLPIMISSIKSKFPIGAIFIDYIQKIKNKQKFGTRQLELADTSNIILETAKSCSVPIILGAQLGRDRDSRDKVKLDNLREAGDLEQDANLVLGLFNPAMEKAQDEQKQLTDRNIDLKITPLKNRNGIVNKTITLKFDRPLLRIKDDKEGKHE